MVIRRESRYETLHFPLFLARRDNPKYIMTSIFLFRFDDEVYEIYILDVEFHRGARFSSLFLFFAVSEEMVLAMKIERCFIRIILPFHIYFLVVPKMDMFAS